MVQGEEVGVVGIVVRGEVYRVDGGAGERLGSTENHDNRSACGNMGEKGRVVAGGGGYSVRSVDGVGGASRKGVIGKV